jgi:hypothetical protein
LACSGSGSSPGAGPQKKEGLGGSLPFILDDVSIIIDKRRHHFVSSHEECKNEGNQEHHDHHYQEYFLEGMSSLMLNIEHKNPTLSTTLTHLNPAQ